MGIKSMFLLFLHFFVFKRVGARFCQKPTFFKVFLQKICKKLATTKITGNWGPQRFFYWRNFAKFRPQKYDFALYKGILMKKIPKVPIFEEFVFKSPDFDTRVTKNMNRILFFLHLHIYYVAKFE
jgi:hypothetical protein